MAPDNTSAPSADAHGHAPVGSTEVPGHHAESGGLPQFEFQYWGGQIVWLLVLFAILYVLFARVFVPRFRKVADARAETIAGALDDARRVQAEADAKAEAMKVEIDRARGEARRLVADAQAAAAEQLAGSQAAQDAELAKQIEAAETRIRSMRDGAMSNVKGIAADVASTMVEKLTGKPVTATEARAVQGNA
ncbi:hypothetical protein [Phenylobacterium sp. SCN 70-31]|uniref:F0F1 ATP synthase subunit B family protein n=1 Tax=Phenylobacterium sp. SCN 70-31 TaxID=1660129 RepID=UPI00086CC1F5|nr:hypothetical protein [Phenylobacterium sp. SCN 70-31]ODT86231.1 MAG: hypothetical protein ABS78_17030 [Phenylobacterium sp. SCN 70-31]